MLFTTHKNLFRNLFSNNTFKLFCCGIAVFNLMASPSFAANDNPIFDAAEYEEWGLDFPGATSSNSDSDTVETEAPPATRPTTQRPATTPQPPTQPPASAQPPVPQQTLPTGGPVPQEVANLFDQAAVHVIVIYGEDDFTVMPGWIVDAERRIIMTFDLLEGAQQIKVAYPQDKNVPEGDISQSLAVQLEHETSMSYVFIQADVMPPAVANLSIRKPAPTQPVVQRPTAQRPTNQRPTTQRPTNQRPTVVANRPTAPIPPANGGYNGGGYNGGQQGGYQPPAPANNPLIGTWFLQDTINGTLIRIGVAFDAQGQFAMEIVGIDSYGQQNQESLYGTYTAQGTTLTLNSSEGVEQSNFWFDNGMLHVQMNSLGTTLIFQPAS